MSQSKETLDAVMRAIELEKETFDFYVKAEHKTFNPAGKRIFKWLAKTEEAHYLKLTELYTSLHESGRWVFYGGSTFDLAPSADGGHGVTLDTDALEALTIAREIELRSMAHYDALIAGTVDADGKAMLTTLRNEEVEHLRVIDEKLRELERA
jgi:rubrerythrin